MPQAACFDGSSRTCDSLCRGTGNMLAGNCFHTDSDPGGGFRMARIVKLRRALLLGFIAIRLLLAQMPVDAQPRRAGANRGTPAASPQAPAKPPTPSKAPASILSSLRS